MVKEEGRDAVQTVVSATGPALWHAPLTVLVDGDTASAAEILAGVTWPYLCLWSPDLCMTMPSELQQSPLFNCTGSVRTLVAMA